MIKVDPADIAQSALTGGMRNTTVNPRREPVTPVVRVRRYAPGPDRRVLMAALDWRAGFS